MLPFLVVGSGDSRQPLVLGRYSLFREIASGGMASVHLGRLLGPAGFARTVAIKRMHPECAKERDFVAMFVDEARLAARVQHPNVVPTLDVVATRGELFLVMDYVRGESLARLERAASALGERIPPRVACAIAIGVLHGLHAAHEAKSERGEQLGMVHRDVSAQNVLVGVDGVARVLDFGIAKALGRIHTTRGGQVKGRLANMSPEQIRGAVVGRTTDVYALGVVLWEALTGSRLFAGATDGETLNRVLSARVRAPSEVVHDLPRALDGIVLRALERDPDLRFKTAREMALALQAAIDPAPASDVGELVERLAAKALSERLEYVTEVESSSSRLPHLDEVLDDDSPEERVANDTRSTRPPSPKPRFTRNTWLVIAAAVVALVAVMTMMLWPRHVEPPVAAATEPLAPSALSAAIAVPSSSTTERAPAPVNPPSPARIGRPHRAAAPAPRPSCDPPWYLDSAGTKKWKAECR